MSSILFTSSSAFFTPPLIILLALIIDVLAGDPKWLYRVIPHPVVLLGKLIAVLETRTNKSGDSSWLQFRWGVQCSVTVIAVAALAGYAIATVCQISPAGMILLAVLASSMIACRGLYTHVRDVMVSLDTSLEEGRVAIAHIVGRDPEGLDESAISRAAIESLAENFSDGTVAPVCWFALLGLPGLCAYKAINTLDSIIGHHNERYEFFGRAAAQIDDAVNYIPARLTAFMIVAAALFIKGANAKDALRAIFKDARYHRSVNAGWPEAAMAGALGIALAGPRMYGGVEVPDQWMNVNGVREAGPEDILRALFLYRVAGGLIMALLLGLAFVIYSFS